MWSFKLEAKNSLRTKKFWLTIVLISLVYVIAFREIKDNLKATTNLQGVLTFSLIGYILASAFLFIGLYVLILGATSINGDLENGTVQISLSKPVNRIQYLIGKFLGQFVSIIVALLFATLLSLVITRYYSISITVKIISDLTIANALTLLSMLQLLALGLLISTFIRSQNTAISVVLILFLVTGLVAPQIVDSMAKDRAREEFHIKTPEDAMKMPVEERNKYHQRQIELQKEYHLRYLFYIPQVLLEDIVIDMQRTTFIKGKIRTEYIRAWDAIKNNPLRVSLLVGLTLVYLIMAVFRFVRMDLR
jgi:ABC-2 type transport system permease protein